MPDRPSRPMPLRELATRWVDCHGHPESPERSMDPHPERYPFAIALMAAVCAGRGDHQPVRTLRKVMAKAPGSPVLRRPPDQSRHTESATVSNDVGNGITLSD